MIIMSSNYFNDNKQEYFLLISDNHEQNQNSNKVVLNVKINFNTSPLPEERTFSINTYKNIKNSTFNNSNYF